MSYSPENKCDPFLRNRVSWVEVHEKDATEPIVTYYSYDEHGNVKSLLQQLPGLAAKRTDYLYDLVSGKVNYVMYQYGQPDQFVHKYMYDADNRIKEVYTSTDRFLFDREAAYQYYHHGPMARVVLGEYTGVQGLDYYYTLQGWIKGVNMAYTNDPSTDGYATSKVGRDVFAYALGYYQGDYLPANNSVITSDTRDQLWTRHGEVMNSTGLFNGNISWMQTDLKKIGQDAGSRVKGVQAMVYKYDQLHRIVQSRSLTSYTAGSGFAARTGSPAAYDEDFSYDANGNLLTLQSRNEAAALQDDFNYTYYAQTNRLQFVHTLPDWTYTGNIESTNKLYQNVTISGTANVANGVSAEVKAVENIFIEEGFDLNDNANLHAYIIGDDEGEFMYDAIGNLVNDQNQGVQIQWTPYGKVRTVTKTDGLVVTFRYDAAGNRIEKRAVNGAGGTVTRYVRDASGNTMAVYTAAITNSTEAPVELSEQPMYGSSRLGQYKGGRVDGVRTLGSKNFELSNHLGNVLAVVTNRINLQADSAWASVINSTDYYAFGGTMPGRNYSTTTYRYGFNGKEKDDSGELGSTTYDYGFRIYNPEIGKFLSVDPLMKKYPELTPYQFASNTPIQAIDLDGLERYDVNGKLRIQPEMIVKKANSEEVKPRQFFIGPNNNFFTSKQIKNMVRAAEYQANYEKLKGSVPKESFLIGQGINIGLVEVAPFFTPTGSFTKGVGLFNYLQQGAKIGLLKSTTQVSAQYLLGNSSNIDKADVVSTFIANTLLRGNAAGFTDELLKANFDYNRDFKMTFDGTKASGDAMIEFGVGLGLRNLNFLPKPVLGQTTNAVNQAANDVAVSVVKTTTKSAAKKAQPTGSNSTNND